MTAGRRAFGGLPREVAILSSISFTVALGYGIVAPALPEFARQFGVSTAAAASVISAFALMRILGALPAGRLVDRVGERVMMPAGIAIVGVSSVLAGFSQTFAELIALRGVGGLGSAMFSVSAQTLLLRSVPGEQRGRASGLYMGSFLIGAISGPAIGGVIAAAWSLRAPFFIYGALLAVPAGIAAVLLSNGVRGEQPARARRSDRSLAELARALRSRAYLAAAATAFADGFAVLGARTAIVPLFVHDVLHRSAAWTGIGLGVVAAVNAAMLLPAGRAADTIGRKPVIVTGCLLAASGLATLALAPDLAGFLGGLVILGLGSGFLDVAPSAMIGDLLGGQGGSVVAAFQMSGDLGAIGGPVAAGLLVDSASYGAAFGLGACVLAAAGVVGTLAPETRQARPQAAAPAATGLP
jgi:MFS family permease